jgi:hypothetical protein
VRRQRFRVLQIPAILSLSIAGLILVYASVVAGEAVATTRPALYLRDDVGVPMILFRIAILSMTTLPMAFLIGYGLIWWVPALSLRVISVVALLFTLVVGLLQFFVYPPSVLGASILKIAFVVLPLAVVTYRNRPVQAAGRR